MKVFLGVWVMGVCLWLNLSELRLGFDCGLGMMGAFTFAEAGVCRDDMVYVSVNLVCGRLGCFGGC